MANYFMPSEVARLILGFLIERGLNRTVTAYLQECSDLAEFYQIMKTGRVPPTKILGQSLLDILNEFAQLKLKAVRSGQLTIQPVVTAEVNSTAAVIAQTKEQAEEAIRQQRLAWKERKGRSRTKTRQSRDPNTETPVINGSQIKTSILSSSPVAPPESTPIFASIPVQSPLCNDGVPITPAAAIDVEEVQKITVCEDQAGDACELLSVSSKAGHVLLSEPSGDGGIRLYESSKVVCTSLRESSGVKCNRVSRKEGSSKHPVQESTTNNRRSEEENAEFLDWLLEDTHFHEKLAENINKALLGRESAASEGVEAQQAGPSPEQDQVERCADLSNKETASGVNKGFNISQIIEMTESDPSFQNFLQLFQQGTAIPLSQLDIPVVNISNELPSQSCDVSTVTPGKEVTSQCTCCSHTDVSDEHTGCQSFVCTVHPLYNAAPQFKDLAHADTNSSPVNPLKHIDNTDVPLVFNSCTSEVLNTSCVNSSLLRHPHHNAHNTAISGCQTQLPDLTGSPETSQYNQESGPQLGANIDVSSSHDISPLAYPDKCSIASTSHCAQYDIEHPQYVDDHKSAVATNSHGLQSCGPQEPPLTSACYEKGAHQNIFVTPDENSMTVFSLIEKSIAEMNGEQFVHRSLRNSSSSSKLAGAAESPPCDRGDNRGTTIEDMSALLIPMVDTPAQGIQISPLPSQNISVTAADTPAQGIQISPLPSQNISVTAADTPAQGILVSPLLPQNNNPISGNQTGLELSSHLLKTNTGVLSLDSSSVVYISETELISSCEDTKKISGEVDTEKKCTLKENRMTSLTSNSVTSSTLSVVSNFSKIEMRKNVLDPRPRPLDGTYSETCREIPVCHSKTVGAHNLESVDKSMPDCLLTLSGQEKSNELRLTVNSKQEEDRFDTKSSLQNSDLVRKDGQSCAGSIQQTLVSHAAGTPVETRDNQEGKNMLGHQVRDRQAVLVVDTPHTFVTHSVANAGQNKAHPSTEECGGFHDVTEAKLQQKEGYNLEIQNVKRQCNSLTKSLDIGKETLQSRSGDAISTFSSCDPALRETGVEQAENSAKHLILSHQEQKTFDRGSLCNSPVKEKADKFQPTLAPSNNICKQPVTKRSQSLVDLSLSQLHRGQIESVQTNLVRGPTGLPNSVGSPPLCPFEATNSNPSRMLPNRIHSHTTCSSLPATLGESIPCSSYFSKSQNMTQNSPLQHTQSGTHTNGSQLQVNSSEESETQPKTVTRKVIAIYSEHAPFIPDHCKKNPSRRIVPKEVDYSTPSPLQDFPSSPMNYVVDLGSSQPGSPFSPKEGISRQLSAGKFMMSPSEHMKMNSQRPVRAFSLHEKPNSLCRAQSFDEQQQDQLEKLGLPASPSKRKPRRVKPIQISSQVNKGWSSFVRSSPSVTQDCSPVIDDAKIVSSTSDVHTSKEAEAFRMLKSFIASSYSKPQPRQEITSTHQTITGSAKMTLKHHKCRARKYGATKDGSYLEDFSKVSGEPISMRNVESSECNNMQTVEYQAGPIVSHVMLSDREFRADESRSRKELPASDSCYQPVKNVLIKNKDAYSDICAHPSSPGSADSGKSFTAVGVVEYVPKGNDEPVKKIENNRICVQSTTSSPRIPFWESIQNLINKSENRGQIQDKSLVSENVLGNQSNSSRASEILDKVLEGTPQDKGHGLKNIKKKTFNEEEKSPVLSPLSDNSESHAKRADVINVQHVLHRGGPPDRSISGLSERAAVSGAKRVASPASTAVTARAESRPCTCKSKNLPCTDNPSCQARMNSPTCTSSLSGKLHGTSPQLVPQKGTNALLSNLANFTQPQFCRECKQKTSESCHYCDNSALINAPNQPLNVRNSAAEAGKSSHSRVSGTTAKTTFTQLTSSCGVPQPACAISACNTENNYLTSTFEELPTNNSLPYFSASDKHVCKSSVGSYTALLKAPITYSDISLTGFISDSLRLAYDIERPPEGAAISLTSPVKHCTSSCGRHEAKQFGNDLYERNIDIVQCRHGSHTSCSRQNATMETSGIPPLRPSSNCDNSSLGPGTNHGNHSLGPGTSHGNHSLGPGTDHGNPSLRPGSPNGCSLLSAAMADCGIPFEGSNLISPQIFNQQGDSLRQENPASQTRTPDSSGPTNADVENRRTKMGRRSRSKALRPNYRNLANILPSLGVRTWDTPEQETAQAQHLEQPHNYANILPKPPEIQNSLLNPWARDIRQDTSTLLCQIQVVSSANGPVIIIPPGHEGALQRLLSESEGTQVPSPQPTAVSNLPIGNCDNARTSESSVSILQENQPLESQTKKLQSQPHIEIINFGAEKESGEISFSKQLSDLTSSDSSCDIHACAVDRHTINRKDEEHREIGSDNLSQHDREQLVRASKTKSVRKIAVRRRIDFTHLRTNKQGSIKTGSKAVTEANVSDSCGSLVDPDQCPSVSVESKQTCECSHSPNIKLCEQNIEGQVKETEDSPVQSDEQAETISNQRQDKVSRLEKKLKKLKNDQVLVSVQTTVVKTTKRSSDAAGNKDINKLERAKSTAKGSFLSGLFRLKTSARNRKKSRIQEAETRKVFNLCEKSTSEHNTTLPFHKHNKHVLQSNLTSSSKLTNPKNIKKMKKRVSTKESDSEKSGENSTELSPFKKEDNSEACRNSKQVNSSLPIDRKRKLKQTELVDFARSTKKRNLNRLGEEAEHLCTRKKSVQIIVDYSAGETIEVGTLKSSSLEKQTEEEPDSLDTDKQQQNSESKFILRNLSSKTSGMLICKKGNKGKGLALKNESLEIRPSQSPKLDNICKYIGSMPVYSLQSILNSASFPGNQQTNAPVNIDSDIQNRNERPKRVRRCIERYSAESTCQVRATPRNRRGQGALSPKKVQQIKQLSEVQRKTKIPNKDSENSDTTAREDMKNYDTETECAVASLELCMREGNFGGLHSYHEQLQNFSKQSSISNVDCPPFSLLQEDVLQVHDLPTTCSPTKQPDYYNLINVSPMKLHLPPKKRLSSDFIINNQADSQHNSDGISSQISERGPEFVGKGSAYSTHTSSAFTSQHLVHSSAPETCGSHPKSIDVLHTTSTPVKLIHSSNALNVSLAPVNFIHSGKDLPASIMPFSGQHFSHEISPDLPSSQTRTETKAMSIYVLQKKPISKSVSKTPSVQTLDHSQVDITLKQLPSLSESVLETPSVQTLDHSQVDITLKQLPSLSESVLKTPSVQTLDHSQVDITLKQLPSLSESVLKTPSVQTLDHSQVDITLKQLPSLSESVLKTPSVQTLDHSQVDITLKQLPSLSESVLKTPSVQTFNKSPLCESSILDRSLPEKTLKQLLSLSAPVSETPSVQILNNSSLRQSPAHDQLPSEKTLKRLLSLSAPVSETSSVQALKHSSPRQSSTQDHLLSKITLEQLPSSSHSSLKIQYDHILPSNQSSISISNRQDSFGNGENVLTKNKPNLELLSTNVHSAHLVQTASRFKESKVQKLLKRLHKKQNM